MVAKSLRSFDIHGKICRVLILKHFYVRSKILGVKVKKTRINYEILRKIMNTMTGQKKLGKN